MQAITLQQDIRQLPIKRNKPIIKNYEGILNSEFKQIAKENFFHSSPRSLHNIRQQIKRRQYQTVIHADTILKLSVFAIVITLILS